jgi:hypothetical protein
MAIAPLPFIGGPETEDLVWPKPVLTLVTPREGDDARHSAPIRELRPEAPIRVGRPLAERRSARRRGQLRRRRIIIGALGLAIATLLALPLTSIGTVTVSGQATPGGAPSGLADGSVYVVQPGDTLATIAEHINPSRAGILVNKMARTLGSHEVVAGEHVILP